MDQSNPERDTDFLRWQVTTAHQNTGDIAAYEFYRDQTELKPYTATIDGDERVYPIFTSDGWQQSEISMNEVLVSTAEVEDTDQSKQVLDEMAAVMACRHGESISNAEITDYLWDGDVYTPATGSITSPSFTLHRSSYFDHLSTTQPLVHELYRELYDAGVPAGAGRKHIRDALAETTLDYRETLAPNLTSSVTGTETEIIRLVGVSALIVLNTPDGHKMMLIQRGDTVHSNPGQYGVVGGIYDPHSNSVREHLVRECIEELLSAEEGTPPAEHPIGRELLSRLDSGNTHLDYLTTVIDPLRTNIHLRGLLYVEHEDFSETILEMLDPNFETAAMHAVSVDDVETIKRVSRVNSLSVTTAPCLFDGLKQLRDKYGVDAVPDVSLHVEGK